MESLLGENETCIDHRTLLSVLNDWTQNSIVQAGFGTVYAAIFILAFVGNSSIIYKIWQQQRFLFTSNIFLCSVCVGQLLLCFTALPATPLQIMRVRWDFGIILCKIRAVTEGSSVLVTSFSLSCIAIDRFKHIVYPNTTPWAPKCAIISVLMMWFAALCTTIPSLINTQINIFYVINSLVINETKVLATGVDDHPVNATRLCGEFCSEYRPEAFQKVYGGALLLLQFVLPLIIMAFCNFKIVRKVNRNLIVSHSYESFQTAAIARKQRVFRTLFLMVLVFISSWLPHIVLNVAVVFFGMTFKKEDQGNFCWLLVHAIGMTSAIWNPLLYFWMSTENMADLKESLRKFTRLEPPCITIRAETPTIEIPGLELPGVENEEMNDLAPVVTPQLSQLQVPMLNRRRLSLAQISDPFCDANLEENDIALEEFIQGDRAHTT